MDPNVDLVFQFGDEAITTGAWLYSHMMYVASGTTGYFNVQSDPTPGVAWVIELYFNDGGAGEFVVDGTTTDFTYGQDEWFWVGINIDVDNGLGEVWFGEEVVFSFETANTIGGIDYFGAAATDAAYYDDVCFEEGYEIIPPVLTPPSNLEAYDEDDDIILTWDAPAGGTIEELIYDNGTNTGAYSYNGYTMSTHMSPAGPCKVLTMKFYTTIQAGDNDFNATLFEWDGSQPGLDIIYEENVTAIDQDWLEVDISAQDITFDGDFVVGFGSINGTTFLGYDATLNNGRSWDFNNTSPSWASWNEAYLIRAVVEYPGGKVAEIGAGVSSLPVVTGAAVNNAVHPSDYSGVTVVKPIDAIVPATDELLGYNIYYSYEMGGFDLLDYTTEETYTHEGAAVFGLHEYYVTAVYDEGESEASNTATVLISSVGELNAGNLQIFPNPASEMLTVKSETELRQVRVFNQTGQVVTGEVLNSKVYHLDVSEFDAGIYLLQIESVDGWSLNRIIVK